MHDCADSGVGVAHCQHAFAREGDVEGVFILEYCIERERCRHFIEKSDDVRWIDR